MLASSRPRTLPLALPLLPLALMALTLGASSAAAQNQIEALGGTYQERVQRIEGSEGKLVVRTAGRSLPLDTVKSIRFGAAGRVKPGQAKLILLDGATLRGTLEAGNEDVIGFKSDALGALRISIEQIRGVIPQSSSLEEERALEERLAAKSTADMVVLEKGGELRGSVVSIDGAKVKIDTDTDGGSGLGVLSYDLIKVKLISIVPLDEPKPLEGLLVAVRLIDGSSLRAKPLSLDDEALVVEHPIGDKGKLSISRPRLESLRVQNGRFAYLSDLTPAQVEQRFPPEFTFEPEVWGFKKDANVAGGPLRLDGRTFAKGLGVHSYSKLTYRLDGQYRRFNALVGLDDGVKYLGEPGFGGVVFRILVDGKPVKDLAEGLRIRKGEDPKPVSIDVSGKKTLTLIADFDPVSLHVLGRANWADAHLIKK